MTEFFGSIKDTADLLKKGGVVVAPTDTLYGILADALNPGAVERVYRIKGRTPSKPVIVLIPSTDFLDKFGVKPSRKESTLLNRKGITVVIELPRSVSDRFRYLHRGTGSIAFRIPENTELIQLMEATDIPLVAPSANPEGMPPAVDVDSAFEYFGNAIDGYVRGKTVVEAVPSTIVKIKGDRPEIIREGSISAEEIEKILKKI
ncbi:L-threonylcarbamoyladenylate synthase [Persephonella sp.]